MSTQNDAVTVVIPTFNGEDYLGEVLDSIAEQDYAGSIEVLVIDSGSTDSTLDIVHGHPGVRLHEIPNAEFGHGRTRNLGAQLATGEIVAFLTQDAIPAHPGWLRELVTPLSDVEAVTGRQIPRASCFPLLKYEIEGVFASLGPVDAPTVVSLEDAPGGAVDDISFYSDVNAATRRSFLIETIPYRDLPYSEDFAFAKDLLLAGYRKAYAPAASVIHSNDLTLREYRKRIFDETLALRRIGHAPKTVSRLGQVLRTGYGVLRDSARIVADPAYSTFAKLGWLVRDPWYQIAKWQSIFVAQHISLDDSHGIARHSLEAERQR